MGNESIRRMASTHTSFIQSFKDLDSGFRFVHTLNHTPPDKDSSPDSTSFKLFFMLDGRGRYYEITPECYARYLSYADSGMVSTAKF